MRPHFVSPSTIESEVFIHEQTKLLFSQTRLSHLGNAALDDGIYFLGLRPDNRHDALF